MRELVENKNLVHELKSLIASTKEQIAISINSSLTLMYWHIGTKINEDIVKNNRAEYGNQIVATVSQQLIQEFGQGYSYSSLTRMMKFAQCFTFENVATLSQHLSWSHFKELLPMEDALQIEFYAQMSSLDNWSVRTLRNRIDSMLYERTALSKKPDELISYEIEKLKEGAVSPTTMLLKDPYVLDFLELNDRYLEKDLEDAILREIEHFILELGNGFSFIARQKRIQIGEDDFYIDLLFYNRKLKRLIAIDLKLGKFKSEYKGQMELYLKWLQKHERQEDENLPLGIILCADKNEEQIELLELEHSDIHVAKYLTILPPKEEFEQRLHKVIENAKQKYQIKG